MDKMKKNITSDTGFTLVEVMVAILFFTFSSIAIFSQLSKSSEIINRSKYLSEASCLATTRIEQYKSLPITDDSLKSTTDGDTTPVQSGHYYIETRITDNAPLAQAMTSQGTSGTVTKLIEILVYDDPEVLNITNPAIRKKRRLIDLYYIKRFKS